MTLVSIFSLIVLGVLMGAQIWRPHLLFKYARWAYLISVFFVLFVACYLSLQQYRVWQASPVAELLLPPYQPASYFLRYVFTNFLMDPLLALLVSGAGLAGVHALNRRAGWRFFEKPEPYLFATGVLLNGHPNWIFYTAVVLAVAIVFSVVKFVAMRSRDVIFSFYYFWLPIAIAAILIHIWFKFPFSS